MKRNFVLSIFVLFNSTTHIELIISWDIFFLSARWKSQRRARERNETLNMNKKNHWRWVSKTQSSHERIFFRYTFFLLWISVMLSVRFLYRSWMNRAVIFCTDCLYFTSHVLVEKLEFFFVGIVYLKSSYCTWYDFDLIKISAWKPQDRKVYFWKSKILWWYFQKCF